MLTIASPLRNDALAGDGGVCGNPGLFTPRLTDNHSAWPSGGQADPAKVAPCHPSAAGPRALRERLAAVSTRPQAAIARRLGNETLRLRGLARSLEAVSPLATVARGYSILRHPDGRVVRSVLDAAPGDRLEARLSDGMLPLKVIED